MKKLSFILFALSLAFTQAYANDATVAETESYKVEKHQSHEGKMPHKKSHTKEQKHLDKHHAHESEATSTNATK